VLTADVIAFVDPQRLPVRHVDVFVNGAPAAEWRLEHDRPTQRTVPVIRGLIQGDGVVRVEFRFREVHSPAELGTGPDTRLLSMMLLISRNLWSLFEAKIISILYGCFAGKNTQK